MSSAPSDDTIYQRLGGYATLETVVEDLYARILADATLAPFFAGSNMSRVRGRQVEFFAAALGGPDPYSGPPIVQIHQGRGITMRHFELVAEYLTNSLDAFGAHPDLTAEILRTIAPLSDDIVSRPSE